MKKIIHYLSDRLIKNKGFIVFVLMIISIRWCFADQYRVPTGSMLPTIHIGDHVFVNKMAYDLKLPFTDFVVKKISDPKRGDIVTFKYPVDPSINYLKRLIAVPGDRVETYDGLVKVNGNITLAEPNDMNVILNALNNSSKIFYYKEAIGKVNFVVKRTPINNRPQKLSFTVPKEMYFVMGDNRDNSADSRYWGFVPRENFKGKITNVTMSVAFENFIPKIDFMRFGKSLN